MPPRPNILLITSDQHRADSLGCAGHPVVRTPNLDKIAAGGCRFLQAHADCPVCIPQRTTWITGLKSHTYGCPDYSASFRVARDRHLLLGSLMTGAGYETALFGKTHWHLDEDERAGFGTLCRETALADEIKRRTGRPGAAFAGLGFNMLNPGPTHLPPELYSTDWLVDRALEFLQRRRDDRPLLLWLSFTDPHPPNVIHEPYYSMYQRETPPPVVRGGWMERRDPLPLRAQREALNFPRMRAAEVADARRVYYGKITNLDHQLGRVFGRMQADGWFDDAWIIYTSDHGEMLGDHDLFGKRCFLSASARVPLLVRPPRAAALAPGRETAELVALDDLLPTLCDIAGCAAPADVTGRSWLPLLRDDGTWRHRDQHGQIAASHMWHDGRHKYLYFADDGAEMVFDGVSDADDSRDLSDDDGLRRALRGALAAHLEAENHPHVRDGDLVNLRTQSPDLAELRARAGAGWGAIGEGCWPV